MYICQIDIDNFKSFAERTVIPFRKGFTTVSGPNGSGKSNIIDSILFCLGLSSSRTMRAEKLSDLINNLSRRRECAVAITFRKEPHERAPGEEAAQLDIPATAVVSEGVALPDSPEEPALRPERDPALLTVARRIKGGAGGYASTYYLDGRPTTLMEIHETLGRYRISPGCFNVMMQGDVAGFVNMSAVERRKIIDEIAGVAEFDRKIEQAERELDATGANIERNLILLREIEARLEQLGAERETALKYQALRQERQEWDNKLLASQYADAQRALRDAQQAIVDGRRQRMDADKAMAELEKTLAQTRQRLLKLSEEVKRKGEDQQIALKKQIESLKGHAARKEDAIGFIDQRTADNLKAIETMKAEIARQRQTIETIDEEAAAYDHQLKELQALYDKEARQYDKLNKRFDAITESSSELGAQRAEIRKRLSAEEDELTGLRREQIALEGERRHRQSERALREEGREQARAQQTELDARLTALGRQCDEQAMEKAAFEVQLQQTQLDVSKGRLSLKEAQATLQSVQRDVMRLESQKRAYEELNLARPVELILNSNLPGIHGALGQLGSVEKPYELAMEVAIGGRIQSLVVDTDQTASDAIAYLQKHRGGRATFLPMNKMQRPRELPYLPRGQGIVDYAIHLIEFNPVYESVFAFALGDTLILETLADARRYLGKFRMVTLDGSLLERSGALTGGSAPGGGRPGSRFANSSKAEQELEACQARLQKAETQKDAQEKSLTRLELRLDELKTAYAQCAQTLARVQAERDALTRQRDDLRARFGAMGEAAEAHRSAARTDGDASDGELDQRLAALTKTCAAREKAVTKLRDELEALESQLPSDQMTELRKEIADVAFQKDHFETQIRNAQADRQAKLTEKHYQAVGVQEYEQRIAQHLEDNQKMAREKAEHQEEIQITRRQIADLDAQTAVLDDELRKLQGERDAAQRQLLEEEKRRHAMENDRAALDARIASLQTRRRELEPQARQLREALAQALGEDADPDAAIAGELPSAEEVQRNLDRLQKRMTAMEPVNMLAIAEYDDVAGRQQALGEKITTLEQEKESLQTRIASYQTLKLDAFRQAFEQVDGHFRTIFADLADGLGRLVLSNPEEPFNGGMTIMAQPRGKKLQRIEAMSGGEKSLTSLAFVFSLQRALPAPFYALDEVDMNLDGVNAEKLAQMVKAEAEKGAQFIVVSLRKPMIEHSNRTVGVTQKRDGVTKVTGVKIRDDAEADAASAPPADATPIPLPVAPPARRKRAKGAAAHAG